MDTDFLKIFFFGFISGALLCCIPLKLAYDSGQKQGQIDCLNGKIYYQKVVQQDSSVTWQYVKK